jgi:osmotically-inducible protein OsmY
MNPRLIHAATLLAAHALFGCAPVIVAGGAAVVAHSVAEERTTMDALRDTEVKLGIENALMNKSHELFGDIYVNVYEGRILLVGTVPTQQDRDDANKIAWSIEGVNAVDDELEVGPDAGVNQYFVDTRLGNEVRLALLRDGTIRSRNYDVVAYKNVVHLTGLALSTDELDRAIRRAQEVKGVKRVVSHVLTIDDPRRVQTTGSTG